MNKRKKRMLWTLLIILLTLALAGGIASRHPIFGAAASGERLERMRRSPNFRDGKFHNRSRTPQMTSDKGFIGALGGFLFDRQPRREPSKALPTVKTNLRSLPLDEEVLVWFGHSSCFVQTGGKRLLVDPVLRSELPMSLMSKPFKGTALYTPNDIPAVDYLIITHDHMDHLDYQTVRMLRERVGRVICGLGVGAHLERWGYAPEQIVEMDWDESFNDGTTTIHCLPARHFSGRGPRPNGTLWASFMIENPGHKIFLSGDGGYDAHYAEIGRRFAPIDLAVMENGQYNQDWRHIHLLPEGLVQAIRDLAPHRVMTNHNSKFSLSRHTWDDPLRQVDSAARIEGFRLLTPRIGEPVRLRDTTQTFDSWWQNID